MWGENRAAQLLPWRMYGKGCHAGGGNVASVLSGDQAGAQTHLTACVDTDTSVAGGALHLREVEAEMPIFGGRTAL